MAKRKSVPMDEDSTSEYVPVRCSVTGCKEYRMDGSDVCPDCYVAITKFCEEGSRPKIK